MNQKAMGSRIRKARERLRMSQDELAARVKRDQRAISEYESGQRKLAAGELPTFARALQVPIMYFFVTDDADEGLEAQLLGEFRRLPTPEARQSALDVLRLFVNAVLGHPDE